MQERAVRADQRRNSGLTLRSGTGFFWLVMAVLFLSCNSALMHEGALKYASSIKLELILGAVAISTPWILAVLPFQAGMSLSKPVWWMFGARVPTIGTFVVIAAYGVFIAYNVLNGSNALTISRVEVVAHKQQDFDRVQAMRDQRTALRREQEALPTYRPTATVAALIEAEKTSKRWKQSGECKDATSRASRDYCAEVRKLEAEHGAAARGETLLATIAEIDQKLSDSGPATGEVDPQAAALAKMTGMTEQDIRAATGMFGPLALEFGALVFLTFAGRAFGWSHLELAGLEARDKQAEEPRFNPAPLVPPEIMRAQPIASLERLSAARKLAEWFFKNCSRHSPQGSMPEHEWFDLYAQVCKRSGNDPMPVESFRRVAATVFVGQPNFRIESVDGITYYKGLLPLMPAEEAAA